MRKLTYRALFVLVGISVLSDAASWLTLWSGLGSGSVIAGTPLVWFSDPIPTTLVAMYMPTMNSLSFSPITRYGLLALMLVVVVRRLVLMIRTGAFAPPKSFGLGMQVLTLIGLAGLAVAVALLFAAPFSEGGLIGWLAVPILGVAKALLPLTLLITEVLSLREEGLVPISQ